MADTFTISAEKRSDAKKSARDTRQSGRVPGVVYGKGTDPVSISLGASDILRTYRKAGQSSIIELDIEGTTVQALIHEVNLHPVRDEIWHVDFLAIQKGQKVIVKIPLTFVGESPAVKTLGGIFTVEHREVEIRCLPKDILHDIEIDISKLAEIHDHVSIADLALDTDKFEIMGFEDSVVLCSIAGKAAEESEVVATPEEGTEGAAAPAAE